MSNTDLIWIIELFSDKDKSDLLKVYHFNSVKDISYVLNMESTTIFNFYHKLIKPRGNLEYVNMYRKKIVA
jgi:hypothetical protein